MTQLDPFWDNYSNQYQICPRGRKAQLHRWRMVQTVVDGKLAWEQLCERCLTERKYEDPTRPASSGWDPL
jgi:hypothetical protein